MCTSWLRGAKKTSRVLSASSGHGTNLTRAYSHLTSPSHLLITIAFSSSFPVFDVYVEHLSWSATWLASVKLRQQTIIYRERYVLHEASRSAPVAPPS